MKMISVKEGAPVENPPGVIRKTLAYDNEVMLCHFTLNKGAKIPLHNHRATQAGYIVKGRVKFLSEDSKNDFEGQAGDSYVFSAFAKHGTIALEDTEYVEAFVPPRNEYKDF